MGTVVCERNRVDIFRRLSTMHERDRETDRPQNGNVDFAISPEIAIIVVIFFQRLCEQTVLTPSGVGENIDECSTRTVKVRGGRVIVKETLSLCVSPVTLVDYLIVFTGFRSVVTVKFCLFECWFDLELANLTRSPVVGCRVQPGGGVKDIKKFTRTISHHLLGE